MLGGFAHLEITHFILTPYMLDFIILSNIYFIKLMWQRFQLILRLIIVKLKKKKNSTIDLESY